VRSITQRNKITDQTATKLAEQVQTGDKETNIGSLKANLTIICLTAPGSKHPGPDALMQLRNGGPPQVP